MKLGKDFGKARRLRSRMILKCRTLVALRIGAQSLRTVVECSVHSTVMRTYQGPPTPTGKSATRDVLVTDEVLMGSHRNCIAQQAYFDARPRDIPRGKAQILVEPGSVIVALWPTRIILYPLSQVRKPKHKKKFIPVKVQLPAG